MDSNKPNSEVPVDVCDKAASHESPIKVDTRDKDASIPIDVPGASTSPINIPDQEDMVVENPNLGMVMDEMPKDNCDSATPTQGCSKAANIISEVMTLLDDTETMLGDHATPIAGYESPNKFDVLDTIVEEEELNSSSLNALNLEINEAARLQGNKSFILVSDRLTRLKAAKLHSSSFQDGIHVS